MVLIGKRVWKSGLAVAVAVALSHLLLGSEQAVFAAFAAIVCLQPTVVQTVQRIWQRIAGVIIGVLVSIPLVYLIGVNPITIGLSVIISMLVAFQVRWREYTPFQAAITAILLIETSTAGPFFHTAALRVTETVLGAVVALAVNFLVFPPDYLSNLRREFANLSQLGVAGLNEISRVLVMPYADVQRKDLALKNLQRARSAVRRIERLRTMQKLHDTSRKWHLFRESPMGAASYSSGTFSIINVLIHSRGMSRVLLDRIERVSALKDLNNRICLVSFERRIGEVCGLLADSYKQATGQFLDEEAVPPAVEEVVAEVRKLEEEFAVVVSENRGNLDFRSVVELSTLTLELGHIAADIQTLSGLGRSLSSSATAGAVSPSA